MEDQEPSRPRVGAILHADGTTSPLRFEQGPDDKTTFLPYDTDGNIASLGPGDRFEVDLIGPGQAVAFSLGPGDQLQADVTGPGQGVAFVMPEQEWL